MDSGSIPIGFDRFSMRMGWKWLGIDGKGYANTTYISEFHPHIPNPWFRIMLLCIWCAFHVFWNPNPNSVSPILPGKCLTGVGYIDADWKVSAIEIKISLDLWTESSTFEFKHLLTTTSWIWGLWFFSGWVAKRYPVPSTRFTERHRLDNDDSDGSSAVPRAVQ